MYVFGEYIDVLSQIRDLQLAIEDFNNDSAGKNIHVYIYRKNERERENERSCKTRRVQKKE